MKEKIDRYFNRTLEHIHRVQKNMLYLINNNDDFTFSLCGCVFKFDLDNCRILMHNVLNHDRSKFSIKQCLPYIELTEYYHQKNKLKNNNYAYPSVEIEKMVDEAVQDHYVKENHHPERLHGLAIKMSYFELVEIVCDLQAMAQEFNEGSCRGYFENVWIKKKSKNFHDDFDWAKTKIFMSKIIEIFELRII